MSTQPTIFIIEDDTSVRRALGRVMTSAGFLWRDFTSVEDLLAAADLGACDCIVADMTLIGMSGLEMKYLLNVSQWEIPVIFLTAHDTEEMRAAAQKEGAAGFFRKPVDNQALLDAIRWVLDKPGPAPSARFSTH